MGCFDKPKMEVKQEPLLTPYQQQLVQQVGGYLQPMIGEGITPYQGQRVAGESPLQQSLFSMAPGTMESIMDPSMASFYDPITAQATNMWQREIMPSVMERMGGMDAASSGGTADALARAGQDLSVNLAAQLAPMGLQARQQQIAAMPVFGQLGESQRAIGQEALTAEQQKWSEAQPYNSPLWNLLPSILPYGSPQMENVAWEKPAGMGYSMLGGAAGGLGMALASMI